MGTPAPPCCSSDLCVSAAAQIHPSCGDSGMISDLVRFPGLGPGVPHRLNKRPPALYADDSFNAHPSCCSPLGCWHGVHWCAILRVTSMSKGGASPSSPIGAFGPKILHAAARAKIRSTCCAIFTSTFRTRILDRAYRFQCGWSSL